MMDAQLQARYESFRAQGVGARSALAYARVEQLLDEACELGVAVVRWVDDEEPYDIGDVDAPEDVARYFASGEWTGPFGCIVEVLGEGGEWAARESLWGIVLGRGGTWWPPSAVTVANGDPYGRVVIAELALELEDELRQAVGDARDALRPPVGLPVA